MIETYGLGEVTVGGGGNNVRWLATKVFKITLAASGTLPSSDITR